MNEYKSPEIVIVPPLIALVQVVPEPVIVPDPLVALTVPVAYGASDAFIPYCSAELDRLPTPWPIRARFRDVVPVSEE